MRAAAFEERQITLFERPHHSSLHGAFGTRRRYDVEASQHRYPMPEERRKLVA